MPKENKPEFGDAPIEPQYKHEMVELARVIDNYFNQGVTGNKRTTGFILLVFPFNIIDGRCNYISNGADRRDVVKLMEEQIKRFKAQGFDEKVQ